MEDKLSQARLLIVDDEEDNVQLLRRILESAGYEHIRSTNHAHEVPELVSEFEPDLVLLDLLMPEKDGYAVLEELSEDLHENEYRPVLVLTSDHTRDAKRRALSGGAKDFLTKPLSPSEVRLRVRNLLETRFLHRALQEHADHLEERVRRRTAALEEARLQTLHRLARAAEYRDDDTGQHTRRVGRSAARIAEALGWGSKAVAKIRLAAPLHDVGKIGIPDSILLSTRRLTAEEFAVMKTHCIIGADLLSSPDVPLLGLAAEIALNHHEKWDGTGYPNGLGGEEIPMSGRIVAVADTFDALTHARPYKKAWSVEAALEEIRRDAGHSFDPAVVAAFENAAATLDLQVA